MFHKFMSGLSYLRTNESLTAIMLSLKPNETDSILSIGGSGDQAFAMLENGSAVLCIDKEPLQIHYIRQRCELLDENNYEGFLKKPEEDLEQWIKRRNEYFEKPNRLDKIRENLSNLEVLCADIQEIVKGKKGFTKAYLSNMTSYYHGEPFKSHEEFKEFMEQLANSLSSGGLIYSVNHDKTCRMYTLSPTPLIKNERLRQPIPNPEGFLPHDLEIDEDRSTIARIHETGGFGWEPAVYRKIK